jgi:transposase
MRTQLAIARALLPDPEAEYRDLGPGYYEQRESTRRRTRNHVRSLERLGYQVTIEPLTPGTGPGAGEQITRTAS